MRPSSRLLAAVSQSASNYLKPNTPTGITGILTHPFPRPTLLYLYSSTLEKLSRLPQDSVYRQSTEALTKQRLAIVDGEVPAGFAEWQKHIADEVIPSIESGEVKVLGEVRRLSVQGKPYLFQSHEEKFVDDRELEWDGERVKADRGEGPRTMEERAHQSKDFSDGEMKKELEKGLKIENEPALTTTQISNLEEKIGAGLIEEVIQVAQREHDLVDIMVENKVWEELEEKPVEGQWSYFGRDTAVLSTQAP